VSLSLALAARHGAALIFCTAVDHAAIIAECAVPQGSLDPTPILSGLDDAARVLLHGMTQRAQAAGVAATSVLLDGPPAGAIVTQAQSASVDAVVMGTQGKGGLERFFLGSTAEGVLRSARVPTFVVHPDDAVAAQPFAHMLVALDDSEPAAAAAAFAFALARADGARVTLARAIGAPAQRAAADAALRNAAEAASSNGVETATVVLEGEPVAELLRAAAALGADAIVAGTHARHGLGRWFLGSVAAGIVRNGRLPAIVVQGARPENGRGHQ